MKHKATLLGILTLFLASCVSILVLLQQPQQSVSPVASSDTKAPAFSVFPSEKLPHRICTKNETGGFVIIAEAEGQLTVEGIDPSLTTSSLLSSCLQLADNSTLEPVAAASDDLQQFGFEAPQASVRFEYGDMSLQLEVGGAVPGQNAYYAWVTGSADIYLWSGADIFLLSAKDFVSTQLTPPPSSIAEGPDAIIFGGSVRESSFVLTRDEAENILYVSSQDKKRRTDRQAVEDITASLFSLQAETVEAYISDKDDLAAYGLETPYSTVCFSYIDTVGETQSIELRASAPSDGNVYLVCNDRPVVYCTPLEALPWLDTQFEDVVSRLPMLFSIENIRSVGIKGPDTLIVFALSENSGELLITGEGGLPVDPERFRSLYQCLIGVPGEEYTRDGVPEDAQELIRVTFTFRDGREPAVMQLFEGPALQAYLSVDGETEFLTKSRYAEIILKNLQRLETGEDISPLY